MGYGICRLSQNQIRLTDGYVNLDALCLTQKEFQSFSVFFRVFA
jgi:hypothetical protein